jgi:hypothetical protein
VLILTKCHFLPSFGNFIVDFAAAESHGSEAHPEV